nr:hypothetical protein [Planctomycetota bacterium]
MTDVRIRIAVGSARIEYEGSRAFFERAIAPLVDALAGATPGPEDAAAEPRSAAWTPASPQHFVQFA